MRAQVNYLGPYLLTRLLLPALVSSAPARVVNVSSVTHRYGVIGDPEAFLSESASGVGAQYPVSVLIRLVLRQFLVIYGVHCFCRQIAEMIFLGSGAEKMVCCFWCLIRR
jgi:NAD(P)-dependent dehydrogenase (short-subunit alcohol dehydrogenase family)